VGGARVLGSGPGEVVSGAVAQVLRLADVEDAALVILHQVDPGRGRELLDLLGRGHRAGLDGRTGLGHGAPEDRASGRPAQECGPSLRYTSRRPRTEGGMTFRPVGGRTTRFARCSDGP